MERSSLTRYKHVESLRRGLDILHHMNQLEGGATIALLAQATGIHRTTVRRILETLVAEGYVRCSDSDDSYWLERKVRDLSEGYRDEHWVSGLAAPLLSELLYKVQWPTDLSTLDVDEMVIRETTHRFSRLSFHRSMVGRRLPLLFTAAGRAYLSWCPEQQLEALLPILVKSLAQPKSESSRRKAIYKLIENTRRQGFGSNHQEWQHENRFAAIALPIVLQSGEIYGCLGLVYLARAMPIEEAAAKFLEPLQETVDKITEGLEVLHSSAAQEPQH